MRCMLQETISTERLLLEPLDESVARAVVSGDVATVSRVDGWPHEDTLDAIRMSTAMGGSSLVWLVRSDSCVIGDCGTVGDLDEAGAVEIGYGLAAESRGRGYGNEVVQALSGWLLDRPGVERVVARGVRADNVPSRRALENAGFVLAGERGGLTWYMVERTRRQAFAGRRASSTASNG
jgi:RimJ/RimL family protein N-acetyltransferase